MARRRKKQFEDLRQQLASVPVPNHRVEEEELPEQGAVRLWVERTYPAWLRPLRKTLRLPERKGFELDGLGLAIYRQVDGERTVEELIDRLAADHALTFFEARALLLHYLQMLMERGLLVVAVPGQTDGAA